MKNTLLTSLAVAALATAVSASNKTLPAVSAGVFALGAVNAQPQGPLHTVNGLANSYTGWSAEGVGNITGGAANEYLIGSIRTNSWAGDLRIMSSTGTVLRTINGGTSERLGTDVTPMGLWTTDSRVDFAVSGTQGSLGNGFVDLYAGNANVNAMAVVVRIAGGPVTGLNSISFGQSIAGGAEFQGDGVPDLVVGAERDNNGSGGVYVYSGAVLRNSTGSVPRDSGSQVVAILNNLSEGNPALGSLYGKSVTIVGDLNGDGRDEFAVGAPHYSNWRGRAYVYDGQTQSLLYARTGVSGSRSGYAVANVGDTNGDGLNDLAIGAPDAFSSNNGGVGSVTVISGAFIANSTGAEVLQTTFGDDAYGAGSPNSSDLEYGASIAGMGDLNGDGMSDFIVGAFSAAAYGPDIAPAINSWPAAPAIGGDNTGAVHLVSGADGALLRQYFGPLGQLGAMGWAVGNAGDLDGDGVADMLMGGITANSFGGLVEAHSGAYTFGQAYGTAAANSTGLPSSIGATGSHSLIADQLTLTCQNLPTNEFGIFFYGLQRSDTGPNGVWIAGSNAGSIVRILNIQNSGSTGSVSIQLPLPTTSAMFGQRLMFQYWSRDGVTTAFSDAIDIGMIR